MFFKVNDVYVFWSNSQPCRDIDHEYLKDFTPSQYLSMRILRADGKPKKEVIELDKHRLKRLKQLYKVNFMRFMKLFVLLDLNTQDSLNVAYEIIIDSLRISGCGFVGSERKETDSLIESYYFNPWDKFPNGPDYYLILFLRQNTGFFQNLFVLKRPLLSKQLDMSKIENIKGTLDNLVITTDQEIIFLGKTIGFNNKENEKKALNFNEFLEEKSNSYSYKKEVRIPKFILGIIGVIMIIIFIGYCF